MGDFSSMYGLTNTQAGWVGGAALGGFAIAIIMLGPVIEKIGIAVSLKMAFVCHILGVILMMFADGFGQLMLGASVIAIGNGCVEAGCNPLVATLYSDNKTTRLNQFHVFWPVGIIVGALFGFWVSNAAADAAIAAGVLADSASVVADPATWSVAFQQAYDAALTGWTLLGLSALQAKMALVLVPTLIYGYMFLGQEIPQTERVQSNVSDDEVKASIASPLFLLMLCCMGLTATLELGPGRWMGEIMTPAMQSSLGTRLDDGGCRDPRAGLRQWSDGSASLLRRRICPQVLADRTVDGIGSARRGRSFCHDLRRDFPIHLPHRHRLLWRHLLLLADDARFRLRADPQQWSDGTVPDGRSGNVDRRLRCGSCDRSDPGLLHCGLHGGQRRSHR